MRGRCFHMLPVLSCRGENGVIDPEVSSEDQPCSECHKANMPSGRTPLMRAYHKNCIECHTAQNKGPTTCGACHK